MPNSKTTQAGRETFEAIGRAVVAFEQLVHRVQAGAALILIEHGLRNERLASIMLAELTAAPLISMYRSLMFEVLQPNKDDTRKLKKIFSWLVQLTERRNELVHSTWFVGWVTLDYPNFDQAAAIRLKRTGSGLEERISKPTAADLLAFERECLEAYGAVDRLTFCAIDGHPLSSVLELPGGYKVGPVAAS